MSTPCTEASVTASDPTVDLAVLFVGGSANLPYLALGDSDVVAAGLPVDALGYPFGREVEELDRCIAVGEWPWQRESSE